MISFPSILISSVPKAGGLGLGFCCCCLFLRIVHHGLKRLVIISTFEKQAKPLFSFSETYLNENHRNFFLFCGIDFTLFTYLSCKFSLACPVVNYCMVDDQGLPQNLYVRKLHTVPRFRGI